MSINNEQITEYLDRYAATLTNLDADAGAALWSTPGMIADDHFSGVLESRDEMAEGLRQSYPIYRQRGLDSVGYEVLGTNALTDGLVLVHVRWIFRDAAGEQLTDSHPYYLLRSEEHGLLACLCIQTDDREQLQALATERGVDLTQPEV